MNRKTVIFVSHWSGLNGAERSLYTLVKGIKKNHYINPIVIVPHHGSLSYHLKKIGVTILTIPYYFWFGPKHESLFSRLFRIFINCLAVIVLLYKIRSIHPELIYTNSLASPVGAFAAKLTSTPHIWHAREFVREDFNGYYDIGEINSMRFVKHVSSAVICNSIAVKQKLMQTIKQDDLFRVIYNGIDLDLFEQTDPDEKYYKYVENSDKISLLIVGAVCPGKGQETAIRAIAVLKDRGYSVCLSIAGEGEPEFVAFLKSLAKELSISELVHFYGFVENVKILYKEAALTLICSCNEAFGRTAIESMAYGTPVIGTRSGGLPEIITDKVNGLLYKPYDYKSLANKIEMLITDRHRYLAIASKGHISVVSRFGAERYVSDIQKIIEHFIDNKPNMKRRKIATNTL